LRINDQILQVGDVNVRSMDSTQVSGVIRNPMFKMQFVKFVVGRVFHIYDESDENYVHLDYAPCLILTSQIRHNRAMSRINHLPIHDLGERIQFELKHIDEQDMLNVAATAAVEGSAISVEKTIDETKSKDETAHVSAVVQPQMPSINLPAIVIEEA
jgi:hypothetical protein